MGYCIRCTTRWEGKNKAHCTACHRTFKSVSGFDKHRRDFHCLDPAEIGMVLKNDAWTTPMDPEMVKNIWGDSRE